MDEKKQATKKAIDTFGEDRWATFEEDVREIMINRELEVIMDAERQKEELLRSESELATRLRRVEEELEGLRTLQRHDERVAKTAESVRKIIAQKKPNRISYYDIGPAERFVGMPITLDYSSEFYERDPDYFFEGNLRSFKRKTIDGFIPEMERKFDEAFSHTHRRRRPIAYFILQIKDTKGRRYASTPAVDVESIRIDDSLDTLFDYFGNLIKRIEENADGYENIVAGENKFYVHFHFTVKYYPEPQCIDNWGTDIKSVEKCPLFNIFTANEKENCILQCAQRIWPVDLDSPDESRHKEATEDCIAKMIKRANNKLCILQPKIYIKNVFNIASYADLMVDPLSPVKKFVVMDPEVVFLLHWRGHIGVLEKMKEQPRNQFRTSFRPLQKYPKCQKLTVCFDIECYFDPYSKTEGTRHIPYLCCACFVYDDEPGNVMDFEGRDCVAQMIDWTADLANQFGHKSIELIAHNGGGYDFHYILSSMYDPAAVKNIMIRNNSFISFKFEHMDIEFSVKDSLNFLLCSLSKAAKSFLSNKDGTVNLDKTDFPHHEVRSGEDLKRTFDKWISVDNVVDVNIEKEKMLITSKHFINYSEDKESRKLIDWAKEYCHNDVIVLSMVWTKFKQTVADIFNCHIVEQTYTLAGLSFRLFEAHLPHGIFLKHPIKEDFMNMREALIGGRCISVNGMYENVACLDVKSLYPAAMAFYDQPHGHYYKTKNRVDNELGIYHVKVEPISVSKHGFFPLRTDKKEVSYSGEFKSYEAWYTSVDIEIGIKEGHKIEYIAFDNEGHVGYSWKKKGKIFKQYITNVLYKLKLKYEEAGDKEKRQVIKIIMNSLWGKFAQKWMNTKYHILCEDDTIISQNECYKIWDTDHMLIKKEQKQEYSQKPVQNGVFTLSWARWHMKLLWDAVAKPEATMLYSDTDSMMVQNNMIKQNVKFILDEELMPAIGSDVGQLEIEHKFDEMICVGKKQYMGKYYLTNGDEQPRPKYKFRFKGVPQQYIKPEMYTHLLKDPSHKVQIDFLKFKREWGAVHGYIESKTLTQT